MADFVAVLKKTIDGLGENTPAMREKVYQKARSTVAAKLAAITPPPPAAVAERQKRALEDAIAAVESSYAGSGRGSVRRAGERVRRSHGEAGQARCADAAGAGRLLCRSEAVAGPRSRTALDGRGSGRTAAWRAVRRRGRGRRRRRRIRADAAPPQFRAADRRRRGAGRAGRRRLRGLAEPGKISRRCLASAAVKPWPARRRPATRPYLQLQPRKPSTTPMRPARASRNSRSG